MKKNWLYLTLIGGLILLDQITKSLIAQNIPHGGIRTIIPGFFNLTHVHNRGAVFGIFNRSDGSPVHLILTLASLAALAVVVAVFIRVPAEQTGLKITLSLVLAGAFGNLLDRISRGYVIDFLDFSVKGYHWPNFNVADSCITIGAGLLIYFVFFKKGSTQCSLC
ncbi:MAG: signal peptidase II [Candidatus Aminicenantes bacterium]